MKDSTYLQQGIVGIEHSLVDVAVILCGRSIKRGGSSGGHHDGVLLFREDDAALLIVDLVTY